MQYHSNTSNPTQRPTKILFKIVDTIQNKTYSTKQWGWITVTEIKQLLQKEFEIPITQQRLFVNTQELTKNNSVLVTYATRGKCVIHLRPPVTLENQLAVIRRYESLPKSAEVENLINSVRKGFNVGLIPKLTLNGTSGSYTLQNRNRKTTAIFKPFDEEPFAPNNPRGYTGKLGSQGFRQGILSGESANREVAAYLIDEKGVYDVPATSFVEILHPYFTNRDMKEFNVEEAKHNMTPMNDASDLGNKNKKLVIKHGSAQKFIEGAEEAGNFGNKLFPDEEVRKIAILDIRTLNCDRNDGNILVQKVNGKYHLIPIDHGLTFPDRISICNYEIVWMEWPHIKKPFTEAELAHINNINPAADVARLSKYLRFRNICLRNFRIAEIVLKVGAKKGLTLYEIGTILYKDEPDMKAPIEEVIENAERVYQVKKFANHKSPIIWDHKRKNPSKNIQVPAQSCTNLEEMKNDSPELLKLNVMEKGELLSPTRILRRMSEHAESVKEFHFKAYHAHDKNCLTPSPAANHLVEKIENDVIPARPSLTKTVSSSASDTKKKDKSTRNSINNREDSTNPSDEISEESNDDDDTAETTPLGGKMKRKSSSIPASLHRVSSLPQIHNGKLAKGKITNKDSDSDEKDEFDELTTKKVAVEEKKDEKYDEIFYDCLTRELEQKIRLLFKREVSEILMPNPKRNRFMSIDNNYEGMGMINNNTGLQNNTIRPL
jgi:hypothetical protein